MDVFVASTPFQLMGCTEARQHFGSRKSKLIIVRPDNKTTVRQIVFLLKTFGWHRDSVIWLSKLTFYPKLSGILRQLLREPIGTLFIGNRASWLQEIFYVSLSFKSLIFLDDGIGSTVLYYREALSKHFQSRIADRKKRLLKLFGLPLQSGFPNRALTFFPVFRW